MIAVQVMIVVDQVILGVVMTEQQKKKQKGQPVAAPIDDNLVTDEITFVIEDELAKLDITEPTEFPVTDTVDPDMIDQLADAMPDISDVGDALVSVAEGTADAAVAVAEGAGEVAGAVVEGVGEILSGL